MCYNILPVNTRPPPTIAGRKLRAEKDNRWRQFVELLHIYTINTKVFIITDVHDKNNVLQQLRDNGMAYFPESNVYCADYNRWGEACKAMLLKELQIDIFFDDFIGYLQWDSQLGPAPLRCLVMPDMFRPYWSPDWKVSGEDGVSFGRRVSPEKLL